MIRVELARRLKDAGIAWTPTAGDRFVIPDVMDDEVFTISDMVVEVRDLPTGAHFEFNGTTEWALDSIDQGAVLWLPREEQLRAILAEAFVSLHAVPGGFVVVIDHDGREERHIDIDAESAYARAVLAAHLS